LWQPHKQLTAFAFTALEIGGKYLGKRVLELNYRRFIYDSRTPAMVFVDFNVNGTPKATNHAHHH